MGRGQAGTGGGDTSGRGAPVVAAERGRRARMRSVTLGGGKLGIGAEPSRVRSDRGQGDVTGNVKRQEHHQTRLEEDVGSGGIEARKAILSAAEGRAKTWLQGGGGSEVQSGLKS